MLIGAPLVAVALIFTCLHTDAQPKSVVPDEQEQVLAALSAHLECVREIEFFDDMYNFDSMRGIDCFHEDGDISHIRVYESRAAASNALQYWNLSDKTTFVVQDRAWFVVGELSNIEALEFTLEGVPSPTKDVRNVPVLTQAQEDRSDCVRFITSALVEFAFAEESFADNRAQYGDLYVGMPELIESLLTIEEAQKLRTIGARSAVELESYLSKFGSPVKKYCASEAPAESVR